jgi:hypothetical protein
MVLFKMSNLHYNRWEAGQLLKRTINPPLEVPLLGYGRMYEILYGQNPNKKQYEVTIKKLPNLHLFRFVAIMSNSLSRQGKWVPCKHMYYVL